ncbi:hypothetical protein [Corynebacterium sp. 335C]
MHRLPNTVQRIARGVRGAESDLRIGRDIADGRGPAGIYGAARGHDARVAPFPADATPREILHAVRAA